DARTQERARAVAAFLRSQYFALWAQANARVRAALPHLDAAWLKANLIVEQDGAVVRVRLRGVRSLAQLEALGRVLTVKKADDYAGAEDAQREMTYLRVLLLAEDSRKESSKLQEIVHGWSLVEDERLKVHTAPR